METILLDSHPVVYKQVPLGSSFGFKMGHMSTSFKQVELSWKTVFNTSTKNSMIYNGIDEANKFAKRAGYEFFSWNGWIYEVDGHKTEFLVSAIDGNGSES